MMRPPDTVTERIALAEPRATALHPRVGVARLAWVLSMSAALALFLAAVPALYRERRVPPAAVREGLAQLGLSADLYAAYYAGVLVVFALVCLAVAALIARRRPDGMALFTAILLTGLGTTNHPNMQALVGRHPTMTFPAAFAVFLVYGSLIVFLFVFPDGRFVPSWMRIPVGVCVAALLLGWFLPDSSLAAPSGLAGLSILLGFGAGVLAQVYRYRRVSGPAQRQQTRWVVFGALSAASGQITVVVAPAVFPSLALPGTQAAVWDLMSFAGITVGYLLIPLSIGAAILRYRLWDIDVIVNRALVYGALTAASVTVYVLVVSGLGTLLQARGDLFVSTMAAGLVAVLFAPLRDWLQRGVSRLMYGERDDPYMVLARLGEQLHVRLAGDAVLPTIVRAVKDALRVPYAAIELQREDGFVVAAAEGVVASEPARLPLVYRGETVGRLVLVPRPGEDGFGPADRRLLNDLARQVGIAAHAVRLTSDLQSSNEGLRAARERLVTAREEERRRLRRDLHDGLGPTLASLFQRLDTAGVLARRDPDAAVALIDDLKGQVKATVADIRRLVYSLRPPALDEFGLVGAIGEQTARCNGTDGLSVSFVAPEHPPTMPAAVEVAAYRIAVEALTNVVRHARARSCRIEITVDGGALCLEITDDGAGLPTACRSGVGIASMRERAAELGGECRVEPGETGGTRVRCRLPLPQE